MITIYRTVDLTKMCRSDVLPGTMFTGESGGHTFIITATRKGVPVPLTGTVTGRFISSDGTGVQLAGNYATIDEQGRAVVTLAGNCYASPGPFGLLINYVDEDENVTVIYSAASYIRVGMPDMIVDPANVINVDAIQAIINDMEGAIAACNTAASYATSASAYLTRVIAPLYDPLRDYAVGEYCTQAGYLYRFVEAATADSWENNVEKCVVVKACTDMTAIRQDVDKAVRIAESEETGIDLDVSDPVGNVLLRLEDGHIKTKEFDSSTVAGAIAAKQDALTFDNAPTASSDNPVKSGGIKTALDAKQDALTFDNVPVSGSNNPVKSGGIRSAIDAVSTVFDSENEDADLDVCDDYGNVLARFEGGAFMTKEFRAYKYRTYKSEKVLYSGSSVTLTVSHAFRKGDRVVIRAERGQKPWDYGAVVSYYEDEKPIKLNWRGDSAYLQYTISQDADSIVAVYPASSAGMPNNTQVTLEVSVLGDIPITPNVVRIASDGTGDFTTMKACLEAIGYKANDVLNPYRIEIYPGTYDTLEGYTAEEIASADIGGGYNQESFVGPKLLNGMSLVGMGTPEEITLTASLDPDDYSSDVRGNISTLNLQGTCSIENLTVIGEHLRYCVHDDFYSVIGMPKRRTVKNCIFRGYDVSGYHPNTTYGAGSFESGGHYEFINCDFGEDVGLHTTAKLYNAVRCRLEHCTGNTFRIGDNMTYSLISAKSTFRFDGCSFRMIDQNMVDSTSHVVIRGSGNSMPMYDVELSCPYATDDVMVVPNAEISFTCSVGTVVERYQDSKHGPKFKLATALANVGGVVVFKDIDNTYIQTKGYIRSDRLGISGFSLHSYIGLSGTSAAIVNSRDLAFGEVMEIGYGSVGFVKLY